MIVLQRFIHPARFSSRILVATLKTNLFTWLCSPILSFSLLIYSFTWYISVILKGIVCNFHAIIRLVFSFSRFFVRASIPLVVKLYFPEILTVVHFYIALQCVGQLTNRKNLTIVILFWVQSTRAYALSDRLAGTANSRRYFGLRKKLMFQKSFGVVRNTKIQFSRCLFDFSKKKLHFKVFTISQCGT